jgi:hypothetical protein
MDSENSHGCTQNAQSGLGYHIVDCFRAIPQSWWWMSHHIAWVTGDVWILELKSSRTRGCVHVHETSPNKFKQTSACKLTATFLWQERSADGEFRAIRDHSNVPSVLQNTKKYCAGLAIQKKAWNADIRCSARTRALLEHFSWELFDHLPYTRPSDCHLFTCLKNWLRSRLFSKNQELMEDVKTWLSSQAADFLDTGIQKRIPRYKSPSSGSE